MSEIRHGILFIKLREKPCSSGWGGIARRRKLTRFSLLFLLSYLVKNEVLVFPSSQAVKLSP